MSEFQSYQRLDQQEEDMGAESPKRTSWCVEPDEQQLREELIQRATTRLKRRILEEDLSKIMEQIVVLQSHLEILHKDATTTIDTVTNLSYDSDMEENKQVIRELQLLEKRLKAHKTDLEQLQSFPRSSVPVSSQEMIKSTSKVSTQSSMSRLSSDSIFGRALSTSSKATSVSSQSDSRSSPDLNNEQRRDRRRRRIQHQRQKYQETIEKAASVDEDYFSRLNDSEDYYQNDWVSKHCMEDDAPFYDLAGKRSFKQGSFCGSVYCDTEQQFAPIPVPEQGNHISTRLRRRQRKRLQEQQQQQLELEQEQSQQHQVYNQYFHLQQHKKQQEYQYKHQHYHHHSQELEQDCISDHEGSIVSIATFSSISTLSNLLPEIRHPLSLNSPVLQCSNGDYFGSTVNNTNDMQYYKNAMQAWLSDSDSIVDETQSIARIRKSIESHTYPERNVLDEAMSFLDGISENGDDGGFGEDMYLLLRNPDLCCRPLSEIQSTIYGLQQKQQSSIISLFSTLLCPGTYLQFFTSVAYSTACTSLEWCRFLSVLAAAVVISLIHGPKDLRSVR